MASKTLEQLVSEILDREAIKELPQRYCDCVWRNDIQGLVHLFATNGTISITGSNPRSATGHADLLAMYRADLSRLPPRPYIHNHVVELKGDGRASGRCYVELRAAGNNMKWLGTGFYEDEYVKVADAWKFLSRTATIVHAESTI